MINFKSRFTVINLTFHFQRTGKRCMARNNQPVFDIVFNVGAQSVLCFVSTLCSKRQFINHTNVLCTLFEMKQFCIVQLAQALREIRSPQRQNKFCLVKVHFVQDYRLSVPLKWLKISFSLPASLSEHLSTSRRTHFWLCSRK